MSSGIKSQISDIKSFVIIVAGGSGSRMKSTVPKQFLPLVGKPVLMHTIQAFYSSDTKPEIIVVLPFDAHIYWKSVCETHNFNIPHQVVIGGETRFHSVKNALDTIDDNINALIAVHDAVRPLTSRHTIDMAYNNAAEYGNAVTAVNSRDSVRQISHGNSKPLVRDEIYLVQTPQIFQSSQIKKAYLQTYDARFTDDASVVENEGFKIHLVEGSHQNIKITFPEDIEIATAILRKANEV